MDMNAEISRSTGLNGLISFQKGEIRVREQSKGIWTAQIVAEANAQSAK